MHEKITQLKIDKTNESVPKNNRDTTLNPPSERVE